MLLIFVSTNNQINKNQMETETKTPSNATLIGLEVFKGLMGNLKCETGDDVDIIGFISKFKSYEISFAGFMEDGYDVIVEDFGKMSSGKWIQMEPSEYQLDIMKLKIDSKRMDLQIKRCDHLLNQAEIHNREMELEKYGQEGAIYSSYY